MQEFKIVSNGPDKTLGNMVPARVQQVIDDFHADVRQRRQDRRSERQPGVDHDEQVHRHEHPTCDADRATRRADLRRIPPDTAGAVLELRGVGKTWPNGTVAVRGVDFDLAARRLRDARRAVRLRQVDGAAHRRGPRARRRPAASRGPTPLPAASSSSRTCSPGATSQRNVELYAELDGMPEGAAPRAHAGGARAGRADRLRGAPAAPALGRHADARGAGARARDPARRCCSSTSRSRPSTSCCASGCRRS